MTDQERNKYERAHQRHDVSLFGHLVTTDASVSVKIMNLSLGGAMVMLYMPGHTSLGDHVRALSIEKFGDIACKVVLKRDCTYHLKFTSPAVSGGSFDAFINGKSR